jgi:hypothetical protein
MANENSSTETTSPFYLNETYEVHFPPNDTFVLTSTMLHHDTPNMFSNAFLSSSRFIETAHRRITITDKSPELFTFIVDYLRGYSIFPLDESAIPKRWLPLHKTYENLKRDAAYYGLLRLEKECHRLLRELIHDARQAVLKLDFAPFSTNFQEAPTGSTHPLAAEMILDCHLADFSSLRRRFLKPGLKTLTYGPMPWKAIFDQLRSATDGDGIIQPDGSSLVEVAAVFLRPPRSMENIVDDRKAEFAKIQISKDITQLILDGVRPSGLHGFVTIRFHVTNCTTRIVFEAQKGGFANYQQRKDGPIAHAQLILNDKLQREGYLGLQGHVFSNEQDYEDETLIPVERESKTVLEVDNTQIEWNTLCQWAKFAEDASALFSASKSSDIATCDRFFGTGRLGEDAEKSPAVVFLFWIE